MSRVLLVIFAILTVSKVCEMGVYLTSYTWDSYLRTPEAVDAAFRSDAKGIEILVHLSPAGEPVVGQTKSSEYTLEKFFNSVIHYHNTLTNEAPVKSVCIYFYETVDVTVVTETVALLKRKENEINFPVWLRASLYGGVDSIGNGHPKFPEPLVFIQEALKLKKVVLSIRWVTHKCADTDTGEYKKEHTKQMIDLLRDAKVDQMKDQEINFCIRGPYAKRSKDALADLFSTMNATNRVTVTIYDDDVYWETWMDPNCPLPPLNLEDTKEAIAHFGAENVYLQMKPEIRAKLQLCRLGNLRCDLDKSLASATVKLTDLLMVMLIILNLLRIFVQCQNQ